MTKPAKWTLREDDWGYPCAIERDGYTMAHLLPGTLRNAEELPTVLRTLNAGEVALGEGEDDG